MSEITERCLERIRQATTAEELAEGLEVWAGAASEAAGNSPRWWIKQLWALIQGSAPDEAPGMLLDELIPEAIAEWTQLRNEVNR